MTEHERLDINATLNQIRLATPQDIEDELDAILVYVRWLQASLVTANATIERMTAAIADVPTKEPPYSDSVKADYDYEMFTAGSAWGSWHTATAVRKAAEQGDEP